jgi:hypothetical protein
MARVSPPTRGRRPCTLSMADTVAGLPRQHAVDPGRVFAVLDGGVTITYAEQLARSRRVAAGLRGHHAGPGSRVHVQLPNRRCAAGGRQDVAVVDEQDVRMEVDLRVAAPEVAGKLPVHRCRAPVEQACLGEGVGAGAQADQPGPSLVRALHGLDDRRVRGRAGVGPVRHEHGVRVIDVAEAAGAADGKQRVPYYHPAPGRHDAEPVELAADLRALLAPKTSLAQASSKGLEPSSTIRTTSRGSRQESCGIWHFYHCRRRPPSRRMGDMEKVNLAREAAQLTEFWSQRVLASGNGNLFKVAKGIGSTNWQAMATRTRYFSLSRAASPSRCETATSISAPATCS